MSDVKPLSTIPKNPELVICLVDFLGNYWGAGYCTRFNQFYLLYNHGYVNLDNYQGWDYD